MSKMVGWESMVNRKIKWSDLWHNDVAIKFLIRPVYDTLHTPVNLHLWKKTTPSCQLCGGGVGSLKHIFSCQTALADGPSNIKRDSGSSQYGNPYKYTKLPKKIDKVCQGWSKSQIKRRQPTKCTVTGNRLGTRG